MTRWDNRRADGQGLRVLLVEDDLRLRRMLALALSDDGHAVTEAGTGREALELVSTDFPDMVLLDLMLPDIDGVEVCRRLRTVSQLPVIMVTARSGSHDVVGGLEAGADDYVSKPVIAKELTARMAAVWRRITPHQPIIHVGPISVSVEQGVARCDGRELQLTRTEFRLLYELAAHADTIVTREQLLQRVWGYDYFGDTRLLDVHVRRLRIKIEQDPSRPRHLVTVRGTGYRLLG
jgi:DNA-binding response OmpR family regulator